MSQFWNGLRPASFRGVSFDSFEQHTESGGRRIVRHEFPLRDTPYAEDLGRKAGQWQVEAFILRNRWADYESARDRLRDALRAAGPGTLVHPWLGQMQVCVDGYTVRESTREGGYCQFSVTFVEAGSLIEPDIQKDTAAKVEEAVNNAEASALDAFLENIDILAQDYDKAMNYAQGTVDTVVGYLNAGATLASSVKAKVREVITAPDRLAGAYLGFISSVMGLGSLVDTQEKTGNASPMLFSPEEDTGALQISSFSFGSFDKAAFSAMLAKRQDVPESSWEEPAGNASISLIENRVYTPITDYIAAITATEMGRLAADTEFSTAEDAMEALRVVVEVIDAVQSAHCADTVYMALDDVRATLSDDVTERGAKLPRLGTATLAATIPALVASYRIYGTADYADEIVSRNRLRHPGRVPGGVELEIVRHDNA